MHVYMANEYNAKYSQLLHWWNEEYEARNTLPKEQAEIIIHSIRSLNTSAIGCVSRTGDKAGRLRGLPSNSQERQP